MPSGENATPNSGKFSYDPIKSPKQEETTIVHATSNTLPASAEKPDRSGKGMK